MNKMKLEIGALRVESFATHAAQDARGTVRGNEVAVLDNGEAINTPVTDPSDRSFIETCWIDTCAGCGTVYMC